MLKCNVLAGNGATRWLLVRWHAYYFVVHGQRADALPLGDVPMYSARNVHVDDDNNSVAGRYFAYRHSPKTSISIAYIRVSLLVASLGLQVNRSLSSLNP